MSSRSVSEISTHLEYDSETGSFRWKASGRGRKQGWFFGSPSHGYMAIYVCGKKYGAHQLAWAITYGSFSQRDIDHVNHNKTDNRICNLREVTRKVNRRNSSRSANNTSGFTGIHWAKKEKRWIAQIRVDGKKLHVGCFKHLEDAVNARSQANVRHGFHGNHGMAASNTTGE